MHLDTDASASEDDSAVQALSSLPINPTAPTVRRQATELELGRTGEQALVLAELERAGSFRAVQIMDSAPADARLAELGCQVLRDLALGSEINCSEVSAAGGIRAVVRAMEVHGDVEGVQRKGCMVLRFLAGGSRRDRIGGAGGEEALWRAKNGYPSARWLAYADEALVAIGWAATLSNDEQRCANLNSDGDADPTAEEGVPRDVSAATAATTSATSSDASAAITAMERASYSPSGPGYPPSGPLRACKCAKCGASVHVTARTIQRRWYEPYGDVPYVCHSRTGTAQRMTACTGASAVPRDGSAAATTAAAAAAATSSDGKMATWVTITDWKRSCRMMAMAAVAVVAAVVAAAAQRRRSGWRGWRWPCRCTRYPGCGLLQQ
jgi:hypothetical protein